MRNGLLLLVLWLASCAIAPPPGVTLVTGFDLNRYLGRWYEIARLDHPFERGLRNDGYGRRPRRWALPRIS